jgi:RES domain-containing protein
MLAWRLCRSVFSGLSGDGARIYGGGWNSPGAPVVYLASSAALALLEVRVNLDLPFALLPDDYALATIDLGDLVIEDLTDLPVDRRAFGDSWLRARRTPVLRVPSIIVPESMNLLLNPAHPEAVHASVVLTRAFSFDRRLWPGG